MSPFVYAAPSRFYALAGRLVPWLWIAAAVLTYAGLYIGFFVAPTDAQQGDSYRIIFIHVPAAWMSMVVYVAMAGWAAVGWIFNVRMAAMLARALAPSGMVFTIIALWTGAFWGRPTWGTWWVWDARLTSELILLFLYIGYLALVEAIDDTRRADQAGALIAIVGVVNVPIIYFSVRWWNTLHQGATITLGGAPKMGAADAPGDAADDAGVLGLCVRHRVHACARDRARARARYRLGARTRARCARSGGMNWHSAGEFFAMGGYGLYVWGAYAATAVLMAAEVVLAARRRRRAFAAIADALADAAVDESSAAAAPTADAHRAETHAIAEAQR